MMVNTLSNALEKAVEEADLKTINRYLNEPNLPHVIDEHFDIITEDLPEDLIIELFDIFLNSLSPAKSYNKEIKNGMFRLIRIGKNKAFIHIVSKYSHKKYKADKDLFFANAAFYGNIELMEFYLKDPKIDPSTNSNSLMVRLINKTKISKTGNNIQAVITLLKSDKRVTDLAAELGQDEILPDSVTDIFIF